MTAKSTALHSAIAAAIAAAAVAGTAPADAQNYPITNAQRATANEVAQRGVPLSELAANAPDSYTIKSGDTLWAISSMYLKSPWRWPELWGMNLSDIKNPHRIYPGQVLLLERKDGVARLRLANPVATSDDTETVRVSPRTRIEPLAANALPTLKSSVIEAFLAEPMILDAETLQSAPRIVATQENRVLLSRGDRAYARGAGLLPEAVGSEFRVFRDATPMKDPDSGEVLGYEAQYVGKAVLARAEGSSEVRESSGDPKSAVVPATIDIVGAKGEMRISDRLLPEPPRALVTYTPRAVPRDMTGRIMSVYGSAVVNASQNQVVSINRGQRDGVESGHVFAILKDGARAVDKTDPSRTLMKLPNERTGLLMVFKTFDRMSYALILEITDGVRVGDRLTSPSP
ncbi:LysM peptidoglycan-binding domain-containing protein [Curvibacter sp. APW13]|uniref:LysM peptidoglycan-binding domain-containing protein n=1 Tax=Curvibacter sp. APW13 TaxID=3077236 RepID=UPI0039656C39